MLGKHTIPSKGYRLLVAMCVSGVLICGSAPAQQSLDSPAGSRPALENRIAELIEQLADPNYRRRESAQAELVAIGLPAFAQLRLAAKFAPDPQLARAAQYLLNSQQVTWSLESDSPQVQATLKYYNRDNDAGRRTKLARLGQQATSDSLVALARLARYENHDHLSRHAALVLLEKTEEFLRDDQPALLGGEQVTAATLGDLLQAIDETIGGSQRGSCVAIRLLSTEARQLVAGELPDESANWQSWEEVANQFSESVGEAADDPDRDAAIRFRYWLGQWLSRTRSREIGLAAARPVIELVDDQTAMPELAAWLLDADLPELIIELEIQNKDLFAATPRLGFALAEAQLKTQGREKAEVSARAASERISEYIRQQMGKLASSHDLMAVEAARRAALFDDLVDRGLYDWAEREIAWVVDSWEQRRRQREDIESDGTLVTNQELQIRLKAGQFYWEGEEFAKAAAVLEPVYRIFVQEQLATPLGQLDLHARVTSNYLFFAGLVAIEAKRFDDAAKLLVDSTLEGKELNPDAVIAFRELAGQEPYAAQYQELLDRARKQHRAEVLEAEQAYESNTDRQRKNTLELNLALACNQLAWLLAKCEVDLDEALQLSRRATELRPDRASLIDTYARCLFAAGNIVEAIRQQRQAIALSPHERQYHRQLAEFVAAQERTQ